MKNIKILKNKDFIYMLILSALFFNVSFFSNVSLVEASSNIIQNPSLEEVSQNNILFPKKWQQGKYGNNTTLFSYSNTGNTGERSATINMTAHKSGDAKWFFDDVNVQAGSEYSFSGYYTANVKSTIMLRFRNISGGFIYQQFKVLPIASDWTRYEGSFTVPSGVVSVTAFHLIKNVGTLSIDDQSISLVDKIAPIISIISPYENQKINGILNASILATDDTEVSSVHILVDDISVSVDESYPYEAIIDTTTLSNGTHVLSAYVEDTAGNIGNSIPISFQVENIVIDNLISNNSVEISNILDQKLPDMWHTGGWGINDTIFSYPVLGSDGIKGLGIQINSYTDGDAKWFFDDVNVDSVFSYDFSEYYKSSIDTNVTVRFTYNDESIQYRDILSLPPSSDWTEVKTNIVLPINVKSITVFHKLSGVGFLETDNYSLVKGSQVVIDPKDHPFSEGMVSLTFDDGWVSHYNTVLPILNNAGLKGSFYIITDETVGVTSDNRISNPDLETVNTEGLPVNWNQGSWGNNDARFTYPVPGENGLNAAKVEINSYTDGDAKWFFDDATIINGQDYEYSESYQSNVDSILVARFKYKDGSTSYKWLAQYAPSTEWSKLNYVISAPENLASLTIFHLIQGVGALSIDSAELNRVPDFVNQDQLIEISNSGHEIGSHTLTHPYLTTLSSPDALIEINQSKIDLIQAGIPSISTFVYPYGDFNDAIIKKVKDAGYIGARSTTNGFNTRVSEKYALLIQQVDRNTTLSQFETWVDTARETKQWLVLMFHQVDNDESQDLGVSPELFQQMVDFLISQQVSVVRLREGITQMF
jgi:peptidoglycan/xylan/chitin deacetylase (PgdA/CDA1 family)